MLPQTTPKPYEMISSTTSYPQHQQLLLQDKRSMTCAVSSRTTTSKTKKKKKTKKVQWYPKVKLWYIAYRSEEDYEAIWYDQDDYVRFKADSRETIDIVRQRCLDSGYPAESALMMNAFPTSASERSIEEDDSCGATTEPQNPTKQ